jgi:hypothetical protein
MAPEASIAEPRAAFTIWDVLSDEVSAQTVVAVAVKQGFR